MSLIKREPSAAQADASRANSQLSTGPRTERGKAVSGGGNGSIMAGPDGATAPPLDGGERGYDRTVIRGARFQVD